MIGALALAAALVVSGAPAAETCAVDDATLTWGFKESFRSYISGTIANGEWTVADGASYETPYFGWTGGAGELDAGRGTIQFTGSITFTGHDGILDTTVANPQLVFDGSDTAMLLLDVSGTTQEGVPVDERAVEFATIDLEGAVGGDDVVLTDSPLVLTGGGATAFGTYEAGEQLDPIRAVLPGAAECDLLPGGPGAGAVFALVGIAFAIIVGLAVLTAVIVVMGLARRGSRSK
jgi:hypothetical protein